MHPNPIFRKASDAVNLTFARQKGFGTLAVAAIDQPPLLSHIPFLLDSDLDSGGAEARFHLVRSNPIARAGGGMARLAVVGAHSYISPDWYGIEDQVPTWNYVAVHLIGRIEPLPQDTLRDLIDAQSKHFEQMLAPKPEWSSAKMTNGVMEKMMRAIAPFRLIINEVHGTWKLGQNKEEAARMAAADQLTIHGIGDGLDELASLMRSLPTV